MRTRHFAHVSAAALAGLSLLCQINAQVSFMEINGVRTPAGISADGSVVVGVGAYNAGLGGLAVRWTASTQSVPLGGASSDVSGISSDGSVAVGTAAGFKPYRWTQADGVTPLTTLSGAFDSRAYGVSGDGTIAVGFSALPGQVFQPTRWVGNNPEALPFLPSGRNEGMAEAVSTDGKTIVGYAGIGSPNIHAVRWTQDEGIFDLGAMGGFNTLATGVSSDGSSIIGYIVPTSVKAPVKGFIWDETNGTTELKLFGHDVIPRAVSADGKFVIGYDQIGGGPLSGFVWTPGSGLRDLSDVLNHEYGLSDELQGWTGLYAWSMSADGRFVGGSGFHDGALQGWLLDRGIEPPSIGEGNGGGPSLSPVPEPSAYGAAASIILLGVAAWKQRKRHPLAVT